MEKKPFVSREKLEEIASVIPTPFHIYDEAGLRRNIRDVQKAFAWNKGFREYFAVKAEPNPVILSILKEEGCGCDCSSMTELMMAKAIGCTGDLTMFSSNDTPPEEYVYSCNMNSCEKEHYEAIKETLIEAYRDRAEKFADDVDKAGYGVRTALEQLYQIYRGR